MLLFTRVIISWHLEWGAGREAQDCRLSERDTGGQRE